MFKRKLLRSLAYLKRDYQKVQKMVEEEDVAFGNMVYDKHIINRVFFCQKLTSRTQPILVISRD